MGSELRRGSPQLRRQEGPCRQWSEGPTLPPAADLLPFSPQILIFEKVDRWPTPHFPKQALLPRQRPTRTNLAQGTQPPIQRQGQLDTGASLSAGLREQTWTKTTGIPDARPNFVLNFSLQCYFVGCCWFLFFIFWAYHRARLPRPGLNKTRFFYSVVLHVACRLGWPELGQPRGTNWGFLLPLAEPRKGSHYPVRSTA